MGSGGLAPGVVATGKPLSYLLILQRNEAGNDNLTGATAESLLASVRFSGNGEHMT